MKPSELLALLQEFFRDKSALRARHEEAARRIPQYEINNTYQYLIAREDAHLDWLRRTIQEMGGALPAEVVAVELPAGRDGDDRLRTILEDDTRLAQALVDAWRARVAAMTHARHHSMLKVILGETLEHKRFFEQALAGRTDLLGRRPAGAGTGGGVLPTRWVE